MVSYKKYAEKYIVFDKDYYTFEPTESNITYTFAPTFKPTSKNEEQNQSQNININKNEFILIVFFSTISGMVFIIFILYYKKYQKRKRNTFIQKIIDEDFGTNFIMDDV